MNRSGTEDRLYRGLVAILEGYISPVTVSSMLEKALQKLGLHEDRLKPEDLSTVVAEAMLGMRLFCKPERLPDLMVDLAEYCEEHGASVPSG